MLGERGRVKIRDTGMYGTIVDCLPGDAHCRIALDWWQLIGRADAVTRRFCTAAVSNLDELVEVGQSDRRESFRAFDTLVIKSCRDLDPLRSPVVVIRRLEDEVRAAVYGWHYKAGEARVVRGVAAEKLVSAVFAAHVDRWTKPFAPERYVADGYSWTMDVYTGNRHFDCGGSNAVPDGLVALLQAVAGVGLPLVWDGRGMSFPEDGAGDA